VLAIAHKLEIIVRLNPLGPTGRDRIAQGTARNEPRPGFQATLAKALKGRDNGSPALSARMRNFTLPRPAVARGSLRPGLSYPGPLGLRAGKTCGSKPVLRGRRGSWETSLPHILRD
jgi:hypothetical protein